MLMAPAMDDIMLLLATSGPVESFEPSRLRQGGFAWFLSAIELLEPGAYQERSLSSCCAQNQMHLTSNCCLWTTAQGNGSHQVPHLIERMSSRPPGECDSPARSVAGTNRVVA
jgi:hypothetical protein